MPGTVFTTRDTTPDTSPVKEYGLDEEWNGGVLTSVKLKLGDSIFEIEEPLGAEEKRQVIGIFSELASEIGEIHNAITDLRTKLNRRGEE